jgi:hypothetical protein
MLLGMQSINEISRLRVDEKFSNEEVYRTVRTLTGAPILILELKHIEEAAGVRRVIHNAICQCMRPGIYV